MNVLPISDWAVSMKKSRKIICNISNPFFIFLIIILFSLFVYAGVGDYGYMILDDNRYVYDNSMVMSGFTMEGIYWSLTTFWASNWHPLTWLSHMLDISLFGPNPGPQHWVNVAFHTLNGMLVYVFAMLLLHHRFASLFIALIFVVHPLHVESVVWISERKDVLCGIFFILSVIAYLRYAQSPGMLRFLAVFCMMALALLSKPMAVTLPVIFLLLDWIVLRRIQFKFGRYRENVYVVLEKIPFFALTLGSIVATLMAQTSAMATVENFSISYRVMNAVVAYATYLADMVTPTKLVPFYPLAPIDFWRTFIPSLGALLLITVFVLKLRNRYPYLLFGWLWFGITLLPVIGLVQVGSQSHADRYMYIPSIGLLIAIAEPLVRVSKRRVKFTYALVCPLVIFYAFLGWIQVGYWSSPHKLWTRTLEIAGDSTSAHTGLLRYFIELRRFEEAEVHARALLEMDPDSGRGFYAVGYVYLRQKKFTIAEKVFREGMRRDPDNAMIVNILALSIEQQGRVEEALPLYRLAAEINPIMQTARNNIKRLESADTSNGGESQ